MSEQKEKDANEKIKEKVKIDKKIEAMVEWMKKYPLAKICIVEINYDVLKNYAENEEDFQQLKQEYKKMVKYYEYARVRKLYGKLTPKQELKCKDGNIGGVFGYPSQIEDFAEIYRN